MLSIFEAGSDKPDVLDACQVMLSIVYSRPVVTSQVFSMLVMSCEVYSRPLVISQVYLMPLVTGRESSTPVNRVGAHEAYGD